MTDAANRQDQALSGLLCFSIYSAEHAFNQFYRPILGEMGLTYPQFLVMVLLWDQDGRTVSGLGQALHLQSNTLTPLLKRLEALGLISRRRDACDERVVRISLTADGRALQKKASGVRDCVAQAVDMPPAQLRSIIETMNRLRDQLRAAAG